MTRVQLIRHATLLIDIAEQVILVDPMLAAAGAYEPVDGTTNPVRWPLIDLPFDASEVIERATAVLLTHTHVDHLDQVALDLLARARIPVFCQPPDVEYLRLCGPIDVRPVAEITEWRGISIRRTGGQHGTGELAELMGPVSGWLLGHDDERLYVAGDTVWCAAVESVLRVFAPQVVVVNAGEARMTVGKPITMDASDVLATAQYPGDRHVIAVHMEALNHCGLTRDTLADAVIGVGVSIPRDGDHIELDS